MTLESYLVCFFTSIIVVYILTLTYFKLTTGKCFSKRDLSGRTVIVTGASAGIGLETARDLASRNARVILACRSLPKGEEVKRDIIRTTGNSNVILKHLDVSSFQSIRDFAADILNTERRLDILVNNAGVMFLPSQEKSVDGLEMIMATNHFGPFLLTNLLLPLLKHSAPSRIVMVSSLAHETSRIDFGNLNAEKSYSMLNVYGVSKLANVLFTRELSIRLKNTGVTVNSLHPGVVKTELGRNINRIIMIFVSLLLGPFSKSAKEGAQTSIYVAVAEELEGVSGKYFSDCREKALKPHALNVKSSQKLWDLSVTVTKLE